MGKVYFEFEAGLYWNGEKLQKLLNIPCEQFVFILVYRIQRLQLSEIDANECLVSVTVHILKGERGTVFEDLLQKVIEHFNVL